MRLAFLSIVLFTVTVSAEVLIDTDFGAAADAVRARDGRPSPMVTGVLPAGWVEDSSGWADLSATCRVVEEEGVAHLAVSAGPVHQGRLQLAWEPLPDVEGTAYHRLTLRLRNRDRVPLTVGLRQRGAPYGFHWSRSGTFSTGWRTWTWDFQLGGDADDLGLWLNFADAGTVDLKSVKLERVSREVFVAAIRARHPDGGPANAVRHSRFPLGLPAGAWIGRDNSDGDEVTVTPDPATPGSTGLPSLRISAREEPVTLTLPPFALPCPIGPHRARVRVKGEGEWTWQLLSEGRVRASTRMNAKAGWQEVAWDFEPELLARFHALRVSGTGELWLDHVQVGPRNRVGTAFAPPTPAEVALALPPSDASAARVQFADEEARVRYRVFGEATGTLRTRIVNAYGEAQDLPPIPLAAGTATGELRHDVFPDRPFGAVRIECRVERDGAVVSPLTELIVHRLPRPRAWGRDAPDSPFGVHTNAVTRHLVAAKAVGINWARLHDAGLQYFGWWRLEPEPGRWTFHDADIRRYRRHHLKLFAELGTAPPWASHYQGSGREDFTYFDKFFQPRDLADYAAYVERVATRYREDIDAFFVWNEPWIHAWWAVDWDEEVGGRAGYVTSERPQADYAALMATAYATVKLVHPEARVSGVNSTTNPTTGATRFSGSDWTAGVVAAGGLDHCDLLDYHQYTAAKCGFPGDEVERGLRTALGPAFAALGDARRPVWMSEGQAQCGRFRYGLYRHTVPDVQPDACLAIGDRLCRQVVSLLANGVDKAFLYSMHSHQGFGGEIPRWAVLVCPDGSLHPAAAAHAAMAWQLEGTRHVRTAAVARDVHAHLFRGEGRAVAVIAGGLDPAPWPLPAGVEARDLFGNPLTAGSPYDDTLVYLGADDVAALVAALRIVD